MYGQWGIRIRPDSKYHSALSQRARLITKRARWDSNPTPNGDLPNLNSYIIHQISFKPSSGYPVPKQYQTTHKRNQKTPPNPKTKHKKHPKQTPTPQEGGQAGPGGFEPSLSGLEVRCLILTWPRAPTRQPTTELIRLSERKKRHISRTDPPDSEPYPRATPQSSATCYTWPSSLPSQEPPS